MTAGYVDQIDIRLAQLTVFYCIFDLKSACQMLGTADTDLDQEIRSHCLTNSRKQFCRKTSSVLKRSAVLVLTMIVHRGQELRREPSVTTVDDHAFPAGIPEPLTCRNVFLNMFLNLFFRKSILDRTVFQYLCVRTLCMPSVTDIGFNLAERKQFAYRQRAVALDHLSGLFCNLKDLIIA